MLGWGTELPDWDVELAEPISFQALVLDTPAPPYSREGAGPAYCPQVD